MKIQRFLISVQQILMSYPDISITTIRKIMNSFEYCLSNKEQSNETICLLLRVIREVSLKQISINTMNDKIIVDNLECKLNELKDDSLNHEKK